METAAARIRSTIWQKRNPLCRTAIDAHICIPLAAIPIDMFDSNSRSSRRAAGDIGKVYGAGRGPADIASRILVGASRAGDAASAAAQLCRFAFVAALRGTSAGGASPNIWHPVDGVLHGGSGARDLNREPHVCASHKIGAHPPVAHVNGTVAKGKDKCGLRSIRL